MLQVSVLMDKTNHFLPILEKVAVDITVVQELDSLLEEVLQTNPLRSSSLAQRIGIRLTNLIINGY